MVNRDVANKRQLVNVDDMVGQDVFVGNLFVTFKNANYACASLFAVAHSAKLGMWGLVERTFGH